MANVEGPVLSLGLDASAAERGARSFSEAIDRIIASGKRAADAVDSLGGEAASAAPEIGRAGTAAVKSASEIDRLGKAASGLQSPFRMAQSAVAGFVGGLGAAVGLRALDFLASLPGQVIAVGDAYQRLDSRLKLAVGSMADVGTAHKDLLDVSQRLGVSFESTGSFFTRIASQSKELGLSYQDLLTVTETLEGAFKLSGASAGETSAAMLQLGQSFASGKLQGDEFRSMAENAPAVLDRMAQALGVTRGELMEMATAGELSTATVISAVQGMAEGVASDLQGMGSTVSESVTRVDNAFKELIAGMSETSGASQGLSAAIDALAAVLSSGALKTAIDVLGVSFSGFYGVLGKGIAMMQAFGNAVAAIGNVKMPELPGGGSVEGLVKQGLSPSKTLLPPPKAEETLSGRGRQILESVGLATPKAKQPQLGDLQAGDIAADTLSRLEASAKEEAIGSFAKNMTAWGKASQDDVRTMVGKSKPAERPTGMIELESVRAGRGGGGKRASGGGGVSAREEKLDLEFGRAFENEIAQLEERSGSALTQTQQRAQDMLRSVTEAHASAMGDQVKLIEMRRDEDLDAINLVALTAEDKARARTMVEEAASHQITQIRQRETDQSLSFMEQLEAAHNRQFRLDKSGNRALEMQRAQQLRQLEMRDDLSPDQRGTARSMILDMTQPTTELERAGESMIEFGERLTSVEGMAQGVIQGISQIGSTASAAFTDAIMSGESFGVTMEKLGEQIARMLIQMAIQMAMQQALGMAVGSMGTAFAPQPGAGAQGGGAGGGGGMAAMGLFAGGGSGFFAKGAVVDTELRHGIYTKPTYFPLNKPGLHPFAKGTGLLGEAGPEAVLPLSRSPGGELGVQSQGGGTQVNIIINNTSSAKISQEEKPNPQGGKDIMITIADEVEGIVASRMTRHGTRVNRAVGGVGYLKSR